MRGFTLVEVMIAALLMSIMALMSWRVLESMTRTQATLHVRGLAVEDTQALFNQWQRDCHALLPPDQWVLGVPVHLGTRQMAWMVHEAGAVRVVSYALVGGVVRRAVSSALTTRGELNGVWQAVLQGELPQNEPSPVQRPHPHLLRFIAHPLVFEQFHSPLFVLHHAAGQHSHQNGQQQGHQQCRASFPSHQSCPVRQT